MSDLLELAIKKTKNLTHVEQDSIAAIILEELEDEARWDQAFSKSQDVLANMAEKALEEDQKGETKELDPDSL